MSIGSILGFLSGGMAKDSFTEVDPSHIARVLMPNSQAIKSITSRAADTICYFPLFVSDTLSTEQVQIISRSVERKLMDEIRIILSNEDIVDISGGQNKQSVINMFKGIALSKGGVSDTDADWTEKHTAGDLATGARSVNADVAAYVIDHGDKLVMENLIPMDSGLGKGRPLNETLNRDGGMGLGVTTSGVSNSSSTTSGGPDDNKKFENAKRLELFKRELSAKDAQSGATVGQVERRVSDLAPLTMPVQVFYKAGDKLRETTVLVAVKTVIHVIPSAEMTAQVGVSLRDDRFIFRTIQWTTGEIAFWKDFILNLDKIKNDVSNDQKTGGWFWSLRTQATNSSAALAFKKEHILPTTTLIMSLDEVEEVKKSYGIDILKAPTAMSLIKLFHLIGLIIVDPAADVMHIFDVVSRKFERTTIPAEERDNNALTKKDMMKTFSALVGSGGSR
jgi:hypothetical protein